MKEQEQLVHVFIICHDFNQGIDVYTKFIATLMKNEYHCHGNMSLIIFLLGLNITCQNNWHVPLQSMLLNMLQLSQFYLVNSLGLFLQNKVV
jgi:hypothetical protein